MAANALGLLLSDDLIFTSRITATAQAQGLPMMVARTQEHLQAFVNQEPPVCVVVDLDNPGLDISDFIQRLRSKAEGTFVVAYGSHVDTAGLRAARAAGCDLVLPRSKFVEDLPTQLSDWFAAGNRLRGGKER